MAILFRPFGFHAPKYFKNYLVFQSFGFGRTWWRLFQKHVVRTKFDVLLQPLKAFLWPMLCLYFFQLRLRIFKIFIHPYPNSKIGKCAKFSICNVLYLWGWKTWKSNVSLLWSFCRWDINVMSKLNYKMWKNTLKRQKRETSKTKGIVLSSIPRSCKNVRNLAWINGLRHTKTRPVFVMRIQFTDSWIPHISETVRATANLFEQIR